MVKVSGLVSPKGTRNGGGSGGGAGVGGAQNVGPARVACRTGSSAVPANASSKNMGTRLGGGTGLTLAGNM